MFHFMEHLALLFLPNQIIYVSLNYGIPIQLQQFIIGICLFWMYQMDT